MRPHQIPLFEPDPVPDYSRAAFVLSSSNAHLPEMMRAWIASPEQMLIICGAPGSGKTHLAHLIAQMHSGDAKITTHASELLDLVRQQRPMDMAQDNHTALMILDDVHANGDDPHLLLDLIEDCRAGAANNQFGGLVLCGRDSPAAWAGALQDLRTRLEAMARISMPEPDEVLMRAVIERHLNARQLALGAEDINAMSSYAAPRLPRTFAAARGFTRTLDMLALSENKRPGIALAREAIAMLATDSGA